MKNFKNILIIGSGAREHAIAAACKRSPQATRLFCCGTTHNPGIKALTEGYAVLDITNAALICEKAQAWQIDLVFIGPEAPLEKGVADALWKCAIPVIGPTKELACIETSKKFARELMQGYEINGVPCFKTFTERTGIEAFLNNLGQDNYVIKADGLMSGKGVKIAGEQLFSFEQALQFCDALLAANQNVTIEEKLIGQEFSLMCFYDGKTLVPMPVVQDHKRAFIDDKGPNTGGMGSYSDADHSLPFLQEADIKSALQINADILHALETECGTEYIGILYGSFMATRDGVYVIEFNARFGDPECLNVLSLLESDFVAICFAMVASRLDITPVKFSRQATVCKYVVPRGYPDEPITNSPVNIEPVSDKTKLYLAGVNLHDNILLATGSRIAAFVGVGASIEAAEKIAEQEIACVQGDVFHRRDIGSLPLIEKRTAHMRKLRSI